MRSLTLLLAATAVGSLVSLVGCNSLTEPNAITITKDEAGAQPAPNAAQPAPRPAEGAAKPGAAPGAAQPAQPTPAPRPAPAPAPQGGQPSCGG